MTVLLVAAGDPELTSTWSGVPNRIVRELRKQGHEVLCRDYEDVIWIKPFRIFYNRIVRRVVPGWFWRMFQCTRFGIALHSRWLVSLVRRLTRAGQRIDLVIAMSYCFDGIRLGVPLVLVHDWTNGYLAELFGETVRARALAFDAATFRAMQQAAKVVTLYPVSAAYLRAAVGDKVSFVCNPINVEGEQPAVSARPSRNILLVGGSTYQPNVETVLAAVDLLNDPSVTVDVVGRTEAATKPTCCTVRFHGYLNQDNPTDRATYERLFANAAVFVNVRRNWCGGSSVAEALYRGVPVLVSENAEISSLYGSVVEMCPAEDAVTLAERLRTFFARSADDRLEQAKHAAALVRDDTYARFVAALVS